MSTSTRLSRRSHQERLLPVAAGKELVAVDLLRAEACAGAWRIVEAYSANAGPFELYAAWSGGDGVGQEARLTVPRATRFAVFASSLSLRVVNLASVENRVGCNVSDGYCVSANQFEVRAGGPGESAGAIAVSVPPFATHLRVDVADPLHLPSVRVTVLDGSGDVRAAIQGNEQPSGGLPLGAAGSVTVLAPPGIRFRAVFQLSI